MGVGRAGGFLSDQIDKGKRKGLGFICLAMTGVSVCAGIAGRTPSDEAGVCHAAHCALKSSKS